MIWPFLVWLAAMVFMLLGADPKLPISDAVANMRLSGDVRGAHRLMFRVELP